MYESRPDTQTNSLSYMNSDMNSMFNSFKIKIYESGHAKCNHTWNTPEFSSKTSKSHITSHAHFYYITKGSGTLYYNSDKINLTPGNLYFIPPFLEHSRECEYMEQIYFHANIYAELSPNVDDIFKNCKRIISLPAEQISEIVNIYAGNKFSDFFRLYSILMADISKIISEYDFDITSDLSYHPITNHAILYIKENLSGSLKISTIAKDLYVSKNKLSSTFYKDTGTQLNIYITSQLMNEIKSLLLETNMTTSEISDKLQFCERSYFSKFFKKNFGCSPKQFRIAFKKSAYYSKNLPADS